MSRNLRKKNIDATACRAWARAETFNGLQKVLQNICVPGPTTLWTYPVSDEDISMKKLKRWRKFFIEKNEKMYFWQKPEGVILHDGNFDSTKSSLHTCLTLWGRMVFVSISSSEKNQLQFGKKWKKIRKNFSLLYLLKNIQSEKNIDITFSLKGSLHKPRKINETMNPIFGLGHEIYELKLKRTKNFFWKKLKFFWQKNEGVILYDGNFVGPKSSLYLCCSSRKRTVSTSD